jgi:hypothetical protein
MGVDKTSTRLVWMLRASWVVLLFASPWHVAAHHSTPVNAVLIVGGWVLGAIGLSSSIALTPVGLTASRLTTIPLMVLVASQSRHAYGDGQDTIALTVAIIAVAGVTALISSSRVAQTMVQASAYGDEARFPLRTPLPYMAPAFVVQLTYTAAIVAGPLLIAARSYVPGSIITLLAVAATFKVPRHLHQLARRWLVIVPAGIVVHDHLVLAETFMVRRSNLIRATPTASPSEEADLTGGVIGRRLVLSLASPDKVVLAPLTKRMLGTTEALHVSSFAIAPRRLDEATTAVTK